MIRLLKPFVISALLFSNQCVSSEVTTQSLIGEQVKKTASQYYVFSGNSNKLLTNTIAQNLSTSLGHSTATRFNDGEIRVKFDESIRKKDIVIVQSTCGTINGSVNDHIMELILMIKAAKRASAGSITAIIPYFGYARQDRKSEGRVTISAADVAELIESAGPTRIVTIDLHCGQIQGFFRNIPVDNLPVSSIFAPYVANLKLRNPVVVSPDAGGAERAYKFQEQLKKLNAEASYAMISKKRAGAGVIEHMSIIGDVNGRDAIIIDDMCDTGGTLVKAAELLKEKGAQKVYVCFTHPVFSNNALQTIANPVFERVITTDTIPLRDKAPDNLVVLSVAPFLARVIEHVQQGTSVSALLSDR
jgi:ribose-phosphate pyrophosphokinase